MTIAAAFSKKSVSTFFVYTICAMFDWDDEKATFNLAKHGVSFNRVRDFDWSTAEIKPDLREDYGELRMTALGFIGTVFYKLVFTERKDSIRIISLRKATKREMKAYGAQT